MQIRELDFTELDTVYELVSQLRSELSYKEFEDLIYDMRHMQYKMFGILEADKLITYAGVCVQTNLSYKRHLYVFDLVSDKRYGGQKYGEMILEYLKDYAKMGMCENIVLAFDLDEKEDDNKFYTQHGFSKKSSLYLKKI